MLELYKESGKKLVMIDATRTIEEIANSVSEELKK